MPKRNGSLSFSFSANNEKQNDGRSQNDGRFAAVAGLTLLCATAAAGESAPRAVVGTLELVADGFSWAENLAFDGRGNLFVSDCNRGQIVRLSHNATTGVVEKNLWGSGFKKFLGLTFAPGAPETLFAVGVQSNGQGAVAEVSTLRPDTYAVIANISHMPNGLARDNATGAIYTTSEVDFIPELGHVYRVAPARNGSAAAVATFADKLWGADGAFIDPASGLLYVSEVLEAKVLVYNLTTAAGAGGKSAAEFKAPAMKSLDDFCVFRQSAASQPVMYGADFTGGKVVRFGLGRGGAVAGDGQVLVEGLRNPTSVRRGLGAAWEGSFYITEGGPLLGKKNNRRVWRWTEPMP